MISFRYYRSERIVGHRGRSGLLSLRNSGFPENTLEKEIKDSFWVFKITTLFLIFQGYTVVLEMFYVCTV